MPNSKATTLKTDQLQPNPFQPRERIKTEDVAELAASIREHGIIEPLVVANTPAGYQIIAGERRWRAAREADLKEVPVNIIKTTPQGMLELALVENVQREDLNPIERAMGFRRLKQEFGFETKQIAKKIGKSPEYVAATLRLLKLPDKVKDALIQGVISEGHARALLAIPEDQELIKAYYQVIKKGLSVRDTESLTREVNYKNPSEYGPKPSPNVTIANELDGRIKQLEQEFRQSYQVPAKIKLSRSSRTTKVVISMKGNPEQTEEGLQQLLQALRTGR